MMDQKNLMLAIVLSIGILLGFQYFYEIPRQQEKARQTQEQAQSTQPVPAPATGTGAPGAAAPVPGVSGAAAPQQFGTPERRAAIAAGTRIAIEAPRVFGSIALKGAKLDDIAVRDYRETTEPFSPPIVLLHPAVSEKPYFVEFGWVAADGSVPVPGPDTIWRADRMALSSDQPLTLSWDNGEGLRFTQTFSIDRDYMLDIKLAVANRSEKSVRMFPYSLVSRTGTPTTAGYYILHEGPVGVLGGTLAEHSYDTLKDKGRIETKSKGGWIGITDKYWLVAVVPPQEQEVRAAFRHQLAGKLDKYQADFTGPEVTLAPGTSVETQARAFVGAKEVRLLDKYADGLGIQNFDLAVDFGWFYFLTKPIFYVLDYFNRIAGNFGLAILLLTVIIKLIFFPLANKSYKAMSGMKKLQPEMMALREKYGNDRQKMNVELMALYKRSKVNPASGCLPIVVQIPVFFALYKVLFVTIEMRHAPFYGWIKDLSVADPTSLFNLFGLIPWQPPELLLVGVWPIIMGITMWLQMRLNPQPADPIQAKIMSFLPVIFTVMLAPFPAGLVIYWAWNNILSMAQQWTIMKRMGVPT
jgi:YidC/Oxa1 family membrane protein insertase